MRYKTKPFRSIKNTSLSNNAYFIRTHRNKRMQIRYIRRAVYARGIRVRMRFKGNALLTQSIINKRGNMKTNKTLQQQWEFFVKWGDSQ